MQRRSTIGALFLLVSVMWSPSNAELSKVIEHDYVTWHQWPVAEGGNDHWYGLVRSAMSGSVAESRAAEWGGHLVSYANAAERDFVVGIVKLKFHSQPYWIGLVKKPGETFSWSDGTPFAADIVPLPNTTNTQTSIQRVLVTPTGQHMFGTDSSLSAAVFEITAHPSALLPVITLFRQETAEVRSPAVTRFRAAAIGPSPLEFQWKVGGEAIAGAMSNVFDLQVSTLSTGAVSVAVSNANGTTESPVLALDVIPFMTTGTRPNYSGDAATNVWWKQWQISQGGNGHWYGIRQQHGEPRTLAESSEFALAIGSEIVTLQTKAEEERVMQFFSLNFFAAFLGAAKEADGSLKWSDSTDVTHASWGQGEPDFSDPADVSIVLSKLDGWGMARPDVRLDATLLERTNSPAEIKPVILSELAPFRLVVGATNELQFEVVGGPPLSYEWMRDGEALLGETNLIFSFRPTNAMQSGAYTLTVSNAFGVATSLPVNATVFVPKPIEVAVAYDATGYIRIAFEHPDDATETVLQESVDLGSAWGDKERRSVPGPHQVVVPVEPDSMYSTRFYRVRRSDN